MSEIKCKHDRFMSDFCAQCLWESDDKYSHIGLKKPIGYLDEESRLMVEYIDEMLGGHFNLYKKIWGEDKDPNNDICRKQLIKVREFLIRKFEVK